MYVQWCPCLQPQQQKPPFACPLSRIDPESNTNGMHIIERKCLLGLASRKEQTWGSVRHLHCHQITTLKATIIESWTAMGHMREHGEEERNSDLYLLLMVWSKDIGGAAVACRQA